MDLERGARAQLTTAAPGTGWGVWNRDGSRLIYRRLNSLFWVSTDGSDQQGGVKASLALDYPASAGPDPDSVIVSRVQPETTMDIFLLSLNGAFAPRTLVTTPAYQGGAQLSPDGHWLVYGSNESSGQFEVRLRRFPELDPQWQVSGARGNQPRWSTNGREIYYCGDAALTAVAFDGRASEPVVGLPVPLFRDEYDWSFSVTLANCPKRPPPYRPQLDGGAETDPRERQRAVMQCAGSPPR